MVINPIENGIVIDHIKAGNAMKLYKILNLDELSCQVAIIKNADSKKMGKKDIIKIDKVIDIDFDILAYIDPDVTVNIIKGGERTKMNNIEPPKIIKNVIKCKNPRCITSVEQELDHIFRLTDRENMVYRCIYCDSKEKK